MKTYIKKLIIKNGIFEHKSMHKASNKLKCTIKFYRISQIQSFIKIKSKEKSHWRLSLWIKSPHFQYIVNPTREPTAPPWFHNLDSSEPQSSVTIALRTGAIRGRRVASFYSPEHPPPPYWKTVYRRCHRMADPRYPIAFVCTQSFASTPMSKGQSVVGVSRDRSRRVEFSVFTRD